jgi:hypothetical protein
MYIAAGLMVHIYNFSYWEVEAGGSQVQGQPLQNSNKRPCLKNKMQTKGLEAWLKW